LQRYNTMPPELAQLNLEIVLTGTEEKEQQQKVMQVGPFLRSYSPYKSP
jgi:hypothetical protein